MSDKISGMYEIIRDANSWEIRLPDVPQWVIRAMHANGLGNPRQILRGGSGGLVSTVQGSRWLGLRFYAYDLKPEPVDWVVKNILRKAGEMAVCRLESVERDSSPHSLISTYKTEVYAIMPPRGDFRPLGEHTAIPAEPERLYMDSFRREYTIVVHTSDLLTEDNIDVIGHQLALCVGTLNANLKEAPRRELHLAGV